MTPPPHPSPPFDFKLVFSAKSDSTKYRVAHLTSPLLDPLMHGGGDGPLHVVFEGSWENAEGLEENQFALDAFQINSLLEYLYHQPLIRAALERADRAPGGLG